MGEQLRAVASGGAGGVAESELSALQKKRKLLERDAWKTYVLTRGPAFALQRTKPAAELTLEMLKDGRRARGCPARPPVAPPSLALSPPLTRPPHVCSWRTTPFKPYNFAPGAGLPPDGGHLHPLLKACDHTLPPPSLPSRQRTRPPSPPQVRDQFRSIFLTLGFSEMATGNFVESSFWNFDTLIQPQQHPARDAHDTFFLSSPASMVTAPEDYVARVRAMHEAGGHGSLGYRYPWRRSEADKNILRTHTTAVSARLLHAAAQRGGPWVPIRAFSIDRVFRNEAVDRTHLAEFHQVEGLIADVGLTLGHLAGAQWVGSRHKYPQIRQHNQICSLVVLTLCFPVLKACCTSSSAGWAWSSCGSSPRTTRTRSRRWRYSRSTRCSTSGSRLATAACSAPRCCAPWGQASRRTSTSSRGGCR